MRTSRSSLLLGCVLLCSLSLLYLGMSGTGCPPKSHRYRWMELNLGSANQSLSFPDNFPEDTPLIFIGGFPRSGTTLMRAMLDAHNAVRCGEETRVIPRLLAMRATWSRSVKERIRLDEAGVTDQVLDSAVRAFLLEVSCSLLNVCLLNKLNLAVGKLSMKILLTLYIYFADIINTLYFLLDRENKLFS